ncbi:MAG: MG2 domain-containing protein [Chitinispirillia bacterium]|nr:MG2 domain-containing protein [Chitinispirillia bacterium]
MRQLQLNNIYVGLLVVIACINTVTGQPYTYVPADRSQAAAVKGGDAKILPAAYLREYDPVTVFFSRDVVPGAVGPIEPSEQLMSIVPAHPGEFIKVDPRTIEFRPAAPWVPLKRYKVTSQKSSRELITLLPLPKAVYPEAGSVDLAPVARVGLEYSSRIDQQALSRLVGFDVCALPGVDDKSCRTMRPSEYRVTETVRGASEYLYQFTFNEPIGYGRRVKISVRLTERAEFKDAVNVYSFETTPEFTMERAGTYGQLLSLSSGGISYDARQAMKFGLERALIVEFSARPADPGLSAVKNMVSVTPAPSEFQYRIDNKRMIINLGIEQEKLYKVTLNPVAIKDRAGRVLTNKKPGSFFAFLPKIAPFAEWERGFGVVERFGPQEFPVKTRGVSSLDMRVYKIDPLHTAFSRFPRSALMVDESGRPPGPGEEPPRLDSIEITRDSRGRERRMSNYQAEAEMKKHIMMLGSPHYSEVVDLDKSGAGKFQSVDLKPMLASVSGKDKPGSYLVGIRLLDGSPTRRYARVDVTDLCLSAVESRDRVLFGVTSYTNGKIVQGAVVRIDGIADGRMAALAEGKTGQDGTFSLVHTPALKEKFKNAVVRRVVVSKDDDVLVLDVRSGPGSAEVFMDNHWYRSSEWLNWLQSDVYQPGRDKKLRGFVRTERPIYRPEDSIFIKGYVRETVHGTINLPAKGLSYIVRVRGPSRTRADFPVTLNEFGSFDLKIAPREEATGEYSVELLNSTEKQKTAEIAETDFMVEAYRIPRFEVRLSSPDRIPNDKPAEVRASASYYAGGRVVGQDIAWKVTSYPYDHRPRGFVNYILSSDGRYGAVAAPRRQGVFEESAKMDDNGSASITLNPQASMAGNPTRYIVEATVTDAGRQTVSTRHAVVALPPFILGVRTNRHITNGSAISARVAAIGVNDSLVAGQKVSVELKKVTWISYLADSDFSGGNPKYITDEAVELVEERSVVTGAEPLHIEFKDQQPGVYILELSSRDRLGRLQTVKVDLYLSGTGTQTWKKPEQNVFETVSDRNFYEPGQQAKILLKSPYKNAQALAVVERPNGEIQHRWININDGQGTFLLDIRQEMAPRIPVSFLLMRPRASMPRRTADGTQADAGKPETIGNTTWLTVNPVANMLDVSLTHVPVTTPNATIDVTVTLKNNQGRPQSGEAALWLVDEAVLSLRKEKGLDPIDAFIEEVHSRIAIRDSRNIAIGHLHTVENPGGGGGDFDDIDGLGNLTPRKNFKTVPYWNPSIKVDKNGIAVVKVPLSSDLTNYSVRAMAVSGPDRFGTAKGRVSVRLPVIVQPALPRFVRLGDRIRAGGVARVVEGPGGPASWSVEAKGLTVGSALNRQIQLDGSRPTALFTDFNVETPPFTSKGALQWDSVTVKMALMRSADKAGDAFEVKIPVLTDRQFVEDVQFARIDKGEAFSWKALPEPARANTVINNLLISDNHYLPKILSAMTALVRYPYGCTEQIVSQSYSPLVYNSVLDKYGIDSPDPSIAESVDRAIEFLKTSQHRDGLFGYWPGTPGYVYLTAYVVDFLTEVKNANKSLKRPYAFDQQMYASAIEALKRSLRSDYGRFVGGHSAYERTAALAALAKSGHTDIGYSRELAAAAREFDVQGAANVFRAINEKKDALETEYALLEKQLWASTIFADRQGAEVFGGFQRRASPAGARMHLSDATALASFVGAMAASSSQNDNVYKRLPLMADELVKMGDGGGWGSTYANSMSLLALRAIVENRGISPSSSSFKFSDGDKSQQITMTGAHSTYWSNGKAGSAAYTGSDSRAFWAKLSRRYMPQAPGSHAEAEQRGFSVKRAVIKINKGAAAERLAIDKGGNTLTFNPGDIAEEHVQVVNSEARLFVAVSVPIAACFEPLNPRLNNAPADARPANKSTKEGDYSAFYDDRVVYFFEKMDAGTYDFYFRTRAITEGDFSHPPARAEMMYQMGVYGSSAGSRIAVKEQ